MTKMSMQLSELLEKAGADDIVREMVGFVAQRLMEFDVDNRCGAGHGERSEGRTNSRNGYRERDWDTRAGTVSRCASPSCARAATSHPSWSRGAPPRRRSRR
jgi:transposase-like protein